MVDFSNEWAYRVYHESVFLSGLPDYFRSCAMSGEHERGAGRYLSYVFDKHHAKRLEAFYYLPIMNDLMITVDRGIK
jgi:hypothetical protein